MGLSRKPKYRRTRGHPRISIYCVPLGSISSSACPDHPTTLTEKGLLSDEPPETQLLPQCPGCIWGIHSVARKGLQGLLGDNGLKTSRPSPSFLPPWPHQLLAPRALSGGWAVFTRLPTGHLSVAGLMPRPRSLKTALSWRPYLLKSPRDLKDH